MKKHNFRTLVLMVLATILMGIGVFAATTQNAKITGNLSFEHEVGVQADVTGTITGQKETVAAFAASFKRKAETTTEEWAIGAINFVEEEAEDSTAAKPIVMTITVTNTGIDVITLDWTDYTSKDNVTVAVAGGYTKGADIAVGASATVTFTFTVTDFTKPVKNFDITNTFVLRTK